MDRFNEFGLGVSRIWLPDKGVDLTKWAVVACDQYTSEPAWWDEADRLVGDAPSTLRMVFPECRLASGAPDPASMIGFMNRYRRDVLTRHTDGFILTERQTSDGTRLGLIAAHDLAAYDERAGAQSLIRATEGTVASRLPARMAIRRGATLDLPHIMTLIDDPGHTLIEPLYALRDRLPLLYDFELMQGGGRIRGWAIEEEIYLQGMARALSALKADADGFLIAVGDGNHSLAAARACWIERGCPDDDSRYALAEICNLHDPSLVFKPIHRAVFTDDPSALAYEFTLYCKKRGIGVVSCDDEQAQLTLLDAPVRLENMRNPLALSVLQPFLDEWLAANPQASIDYIHGDNVLQSLHCCRIRLKGIDKADLFPAVRLGGALPRKTFSMGEARDKRYYLESRAIGELTDR